MDSFLYHIRLLTKANLAKAEDAKLRVFYVKGEDSRAANVGLCRAL